MLWYSIVYAWQLHINETLKPLTLSINSGVFSLSDHVKTQVGTDSCEVGSLAGVGSRCSASGARQN